MKSSKGYAKGTIAAAVAIGSIVAVAPMATQASTQFSDVKVNDYFYEDVLQLAERGVVNGFKDGTFKPKQDVTRGQAAKIIAGILGLDTKNVTDPGYKDVPKSHPFYGAIAALANAGIIDGYENGTFRSGDAMQRNHMAKIIASAFNLEAPADVKTPFTDVRAEYAKYVTALYTADITTGLTTTKFGGTSNVTRGQLVSFVVRAEKANTDVAKDVTFTISQVAGNKVGDYIITTSLKGLINEANNLALKGAVIKATVMGDEIVAINSLQLNAAGTEGAPVVLDGANYSMTGDLVVNADFVKVKNVTVQGNVSLTNNVMKNFTTDGLVNVGQLIVEKTNAVVASLTPIVANTTNGPEIDLKNSQVSHVNVMRNDVTISSNVKLPELTVSADVSAIQVDANVVKVVVDVTVNIAISGTGSFDVVMLEKAVNLALEIIGSVAKLAVNNTGAKVDVAATIKIGEVVLPGDATAKDIIKNYESIKGNINNVVNGNGTTPPVSGGAGSGGSGSGNGGSTPEVEAPATKYEVTFTTTNGARTEVRNSQNQVIIAKADGSYQLADGKYSYTVTKEGYKTVIGSLTVAGTKLTIPVELVAELSVSLVTNEFIAQGVDITSQLANAFKITYGNEVQENAKIMDYTFASSEDAVIADATDSNEIKIKSVGSTELTISTITVDLDGGGDKYDPEVITVNSIITVDAKIALTAPSNMNTLEIPALVHPGNMKFMISGLNQEGIESQKVVRIAVVKEFLKENYGVNFDEKKIAVKKGVLTVEKDLLSPSDWTKVKANGDKKVAYKITVLDGDNKETDKVAKIAMYADGTVAIESLFTTPQ